MTVTTLAYIPSPAQGVWFIGPVPLRAYALCIIIGIVAALVIGDRRWEARGGERGVIYDIALWAVPFGLVGGRIYHVLTDWPTYFGAGGAGLGAAFRIWDGGLGIWGAVALGGVGAWIGCRQRGIPLPAFGDAIAPGIILAQAIGRLGNYFNQELYGRATTLPWGLEIYERRDAAGFRDSLNGVSTGELVGVVHPTFLYELLWNLLIFALLIWIDRRYKLGHGKVFALYVAGYCLGRFWIELMRSDTATLIAGIRVNSFTSTFIFIAAVVYVMVAPKGREDPESLRGKDNADEESAVDEVATEVIAVGAGAGVVAAAKVAGAAEGEDSDKADPVEGAKVADAADEADEVEEPVETEVLVIAEPEPEGDSVAAAEAAVEEPVEATVTDADADGHAPDALETSAAEVTSEAAVSEVLTAQPRVAADEPAQVGESADADEAEAEEPVVEAESADVEESPEAEAADASVAAETEAEAELAESDSDEAAVSEAQTEEPAADAEEEPAADEPAEPEVEESPEAEAADASVAADDPALAEGSAVAEAEVAESDSDEAAVSEAETEEPPAAEVTSEAAVSDVLTAQPPVAADEPAQVGESADGDDAEAEEPVVEAESADVEESPEAEAADASVAAETEAEAELAESDSDEAAVSEAQTEEPAADAEEEPAADEPAEPEVEEAEGDELTEADEPSADETETESEPDSAATDSAADAPAEATPAESSRETKSLGERFRKPRWFRRNS